MRRLRRTDRSHWELAGAVTKKQMGADHRCDSDADFAAENRLTSGDNRSSELYPECGLLFPLAALSRAAIGALLLLSPTADRACPFRLRPLPYLDRRDLRRCSIEDRKTPLRDGAVRRPRLGRVGNGAALFEVASASIAVKGSSRSRAGSPYRGSTSDDKTINASLCAFMERTQASCDLSPFRRADRRFGGVAGRMTNDKSAAVPCLDGR